MWGDGWFDINKYIIFLFLAETKDGDEEIKDSDAGSNEKDKEPDSDKPKEQSKEEPTSEDKGQEKQTAENKTETKLNETKPVDKKPKLVTIKHDLKLEVEQVDLIDPSKEVIDASKKK